VREREHEARVGSQDVCCMHVRQARDIVRLGSADGGSDRAAEKD